MKLLFLEASSRIFGEAENTIEWEVPNTNSANSFRIEHEYQILYKSLRKFRNQILRKDEQIYPAFPASNLIHSLSILAI
jgi:hypothetical protein